MISSIKEKLNGMGILGEPLYWISSYLKDRQQIVRIKHMGSDGLTSLYRSNVSPDMNTGIPQGSNLGPVLFMLYVNILPQSLCEGNIWLFADDISHLLQANDKEFLRNKAQKVFIK